MAQSRKNPNRKNKQNNFKNKHKQMSQPNQQNQQQLPLVRTVPYWGNTADINVKGFEWEVIQNALGQLALASQATQAVMSRNIVEGTIKMRFEKLNPLTVGYDPMTDEEQAPYIADYNVMIEKFKEQQRAEAVKQPTTSAIVSETGEPFVTEKVKKPRAKVVKLQPKEAEKA